jgi:hypothetical protein
VAPCEALLDILLGLKTLHELDDLKVGHIDLRMLGGIEVLLGVQNALLKQILVHFYPILLRDQHDACRLLRARESRKNRTKQDNPKKAQGRSKRIAR